MKRTITTYTILLIAALALAYYVSLPRADIESSRTDWVEIDAKKVTKLTFKGPKVSVTATRDGAPNRFWVDAVEQTGKEGEAAKEVAERFLASGKMDDLLKSLQPLRAERVIGEVAAGKQEEYGIKADSGEFQVHHGDDLKLNLKLGARSFGTRHQFALDQLTKRVILIDSGDIENFEKARARLVERELFKTSYDEIAKVEVVSGDRVKKLDHTRRGKSGELDWRDDDEQAEANATYQTWMGKIQKLRVLNYGSPEELVQVQQQPSFLMLKFFKGGKEVERLEFRKLAEVTAGLDSGTSPAAEDKKDPQPKHSYWVQSTYLGAFAKLSNSRLDTIEKDIPAIFGGGKAGITDSEAPPAEEGPELQ